VSLWILKLKNSISASFRNLSSLDLDFAEVHSGPVGHMNKGAIRDLVLQHANFDLADWTAVAIFVDGVRKDGLIAKVAAAV